MENLAPVLITTLNRSVHFKRCVESLALSTLADKTELYIALDYPLHEGQRAGYEEIKKYLSDIKGFKSVIIIERDKNFGAIDNFFKSLDEVFEKYDKVIISEDDNVFSTDFIAFVNKGLNVYESRADIFSISGYQYPVKVPKSYKEDVYIWTGFSAWGVGIWKEKWEKVNFEPEIAMDNIRNFLKNYLEVYKLQKIANHFLPAMIEMLKQKSIHGDSLICLYLYQNKMNSIFPIISRVRNTGHDGSGLHGGNLESNIYREQAIFCGNENHVHIKNIQPHKATNNMLYSFFKSSYKRKVLIMLKLLQINFGLLYAKKDNE